MSIPSACCKLAPVKSDYTPKGTTINIGGLAVYESKDPHHQDSNKRVLICTYDIFGFHNVTKQVVDKLAECGFRVVMPDFFHGEPFPLANFPPSEWTELHKWITEKGSWEKVVKNDLLKVLQHYKENEKVNAFAIFGFCWGARISVDAITEIPDIQAAGLIHPSGVKTEDAEKIKKPMIVLPTKDDDDMTPFCEILKTNNGAHTVEHHRFVDMHHGFCAARGDLSNELNRQRVDEALEVLQKFFNKNVK